MSVNIRTAEISHAPAIADFNRRMAAETENYILPYDKILSGVKNLFLKKEYGFYIIAESQNEIAGCLMITFEWSDWRDGLLWWIQSVYIAPEYRRQGVFSKMYKFVSDYAKKEKAVGLRLYVEKNNADAQKTYLALGMEETKYKLFELVFCDGKTDTINGA
jgi:ribosomal protein S18 acetylase RimI-like enzyme